MNQYAVVGHPIQHSQSPFIHTKFAQQCGIALSYRAIQVEPGSFANVSSQLHQQGYSGLNVTLPFKTEALALAHRVSERARLAGAVNTLIRDQHGWFGDNTDGIGLIRDLQRLKLAIRNQRVLILGAGGAARGILGPLLEQTPAELVIANRTPWKPEQLADTFATYGNIRAATYLSLKGDHFNLLINATSAGHTGQMVRLPPGLLAANAGVYDLSYGGASAPLKRWAHAQNCNAHDGLGMLVEQAAEAFNEFCGVTPACTPVLEQLRKKMAVAEM